MPTMLPEMMLIEPAAAPPTVLFGESISIALPVLPSAIVPVISVPM